MSMEKTRTKQQWVDVLRNTQLLINEEQELCNYHTSRLESLKDDEYTAKEMINELSRNENN